MSAKHPAVPPELVHAIDTALARVDEHRATLDRVRTSEAPLPALRLAHREMRAAYQEADRLLRAATDAARSHSRREWMAWRKRLAPVSTARQVHLLEEADDSAVRPLGSVRALDTGMSGPAIGDLLHGECGVPHAEPEYGLDLEAVLTGREETPPTAEVIDLSPAEPVDPRPAASVA